MMLRKMLVLIGFSVFCLQSCRIARLNELSSFGAEPEQFADLPIPRDFQLLTGAGKSWSHREGQFRAAHLMYRGEGGIRRLRQFLAAQLDKQGWDLVENETQHHGQIKQQWTRRPAPHVVYVLTASLEVQGSRTQLIYDLATRRTGRALPAETDRGASSKAAGEATGAAAPSQKTDPVK